MPTTHENFGHAVVEAWAHGRPVLLSDQTPWRGLAELDLGWDLQLDVDVWAHHLTQSAVLGARGLGAHVRRLPKEARVHCRGSKAGLGQPLGV